MKVVKGLYSSTIEQNKACAYCRHHRCCLTVKQLKSHSCLKKQCHYLVKYEQHDWWRQREITKNKRKEKKIRINKMFEKDGIKHEV